MFVKQTQRTIVIVKGKLIKESFVVLVEFSNIADPMNHHGEAFDTESLNMKV
jgi:hypothetical protein